MATLSQRKQAQLAPKYILEINGLNLFISEKQGLTGCNLTETQSEAMKYAVGFDHEETKAGYWEAKAKMLINTPVKINVVYL